MKVTLFSRNGLQDSFFEGVGRDLSANGFDVNIIYPRAGESVGGAFFPESVISDSMQQNDLDYESIFSRICQEYDDINRIIQSERELNYFPRYFNDPVVSREKKIKFLCSAVICFEKYIAEVAPDVIVSEMVTGMLDGVLFEVAKKRNIPYWGIRSSKVGEGVIFCDNLFDRPVLFDATQTRWRTQPMEVLKSKAADIVARHLVATAAPHYMKLTGRPFKIFSWKKLKTAFRILFKSKPLPPVTIYQHNVLNAFREKYVKAKNLSSWKFKDAEVREACERYKFFVYAAHFEPEASVSVRAFDFSDQLGLIKMLSRLLPPDCILVVKEHKGNEGFRRTDFYRDLAHDFNVMCASPSMNLRELISKSAAVITLTGRVGLEGLVAGIPVVSFGETFWTEMPNVNRPKSTLEIRRLLSELAVNYKKDAYNKGHNLSPELCALLISYTELTYHANFVHGSDQFTSPENLKRISGAIQDLIRRTGLSSD